jgi:lipoprotein-releasing system permease protein
VKLELELAIRFLRRRTSLLLRGTSLAAFAGVTLATAALVITLALMSGYSDAIAVALQRGNAHMVGFSPRMLTTQQAAGLAERLAASDGVKQAAPVTYLSGLLEDPNRPTQPVPITIKAVSAPPAYTGLEEWPDTELPPAVVGARLAEALGLETGASVMVRLPPEVGSWILPGLRLQVAGTFRLAYSEFDESWVVIPLERAVAAIPGIGAAGIEVELVDPLAVERVRRQLEQAEPSLLFADWREMNRSLFAALRWQTLSLFVVLSLVVAVSSFQVSSALVVLAINKRRSAGMLQALGATPARIRQILVFSGLLLGGAGVGTGIVIGCATSWLMTSLRLIRFPPGLARVYLVDFIPLEPRPLHLLAVVVVCLGLVFLASLWPAWKTSREDPVAALKAV